MVLQEQRITLVRHQRLLEGTTNEQIRWLAAALGMFNPRDKESCQFRIFIEILKSLRTKKGLSSDELAYRLRISRGNTVHHLKKLLEAGIITKEGKKYTLRSYNLESLIYELQRDARNAFEDIKEVAKKIDKDLGL